MSECLMELLGESTRFIVTRETEITVYCVNGSTTTNVHSFHPVVKEGKCINISEIYDYSTDDFDIALSEPLKEFTFKLEHGKVSQIRVVIDCSKDKLLDDIFLSEYVGNELSCNNLNEVKQLYLRMKNGIAKHYNWDKEK